MIPQITGMNVMKYIRQKSTVPIIIISAKDSDSDKTLGLGLGADDYITKPFSITEVMARIKANIRRNTEYAAVQLEQTKLVCGTLVMNLENHTVTKSGEIIELTAKEFDILRLLMENPRRVYTKAQIYSLIWYDAYMGDENVTDVNIHIPKGEIYGFLGPNGAGKTTVMKMITNLWKPTSGTIEVFGEVLTPKSYEVLKRMGSIIEFPTFYDHMTGRENLQLHCEYMGYYNVDSVESALQMLDLTSAADQPVKNYSLGMKERLGIARAIMCKPELLILDEPTNGLDPAGMKQIRDLLKTLCSEYGITVMISSHILSEVESIADTVAIIHHGKMMKEIRMQDIEEMNLNYVELSVTDEKRAAYVLTEKLGLQNFKILDSGKIRIYDHAASTQQLTKILALNDVEVVSIGKKSETLEDYFLKLTGEVKYHA